MAPYSPEQNKMLKSRGISATTIKWYQICDITKEETGGEVAASSHRYRELVLQEWISDGLDLFDTSVFWEARRNVEYNVPMWQDSIWQDQYNNTFDLHLLTLQFYAENLKNSAFNKWI